MKRILITGAAGFLGRLLAARLCATDLRLDRLVLADRAGFPGLPRVSWLEGDLADINYVERLAAEKCDTVFHLASLPGGQAEHEPSRGRRINLDATINLFDAMARTGSGDAAPPTVIFASSIAVYGSSMPALVDEQTDLQPALTYGAHKRMCEIVLADFIRRRQLGGCSVRLPGIVARPRGPAGQASAFMSELFHAMATGERFVCPVSPEATAWWMSGDCAVENLLHAAGLSAGWQKPGRVWQLPVLHLRMSEVVDALSERFGNECRSLISYRPEEILERTFGRYPPLDDRSARDAGFFDDGTRAQLIARAMRTYDITNGGAFENAINTNFIA